jgi:hypothetical protein
MTILVIRPGIIVTAANRPALRCSLLRQHIDHSQARPIGAALANEIVLRPVVRLALVVVEVPKELKAEQVGVDPQPEQFAFDVPAISACAPPSADVK